MTARICYVTTCRSDYGPSYWLIHDLFADPRFEVQLLVGGAHLSQSHGATLKEIEEDGFSIAGTVPFLSASPAESSARAMEGFAVEFRRLAPDLVVLYGDRFELLAVANAALLAEVPVAHLCGGDITEGAIDDSVRHAVTKLAHLHFPSSARSARRILQLGEEPWRVHEVGDPSLDRMRRGPSATPEELAKVLGWVPDRSTLLVTFHPPTLDLPALPAQLKALCSALAEHRGGIVITAPAPDPGAPMIREALSAFARERPNTVFLESLGSHRYRGLMSAAGAMLGNSSSGLSEAPCFELPVVNIGRRQAGRERGANVVDAEPTREAIGQALRRALDPEFRSSLRGIRSPYGDGRTAGRIISALSAMPSRSTLLNKRFVDVFAAARPDRQPPLGGDFPLDPAALWGATSSFSTGRDAFFAIAESRPGRWLVPAFTCPAVPMALRSAGADVEAYSLHSPWTIDTDRLAGALEGAAGVVVPFHMGLPPSEDIWTVLARMPRLCVVEDRCQCVELPPDVRELRGDFAVGSCRKWTGAPDGAWCVARAGAAPAPGLEASRRMVRLRMAAGLVKAAWQEDGDPEGLLERIAVELFREGEAAADRGRRPRRASTISDQALAGLDVASVRERRLENQRWLADRLETSSVVKLWEPWPGAIAASPEPMLAVPVLARERDSLRARLAEHRVFCAVHWSGGDWSHQAGLPEEWSAHTLSLPVDQRLGSSDLQRIVDALR